MESTLSVPSGTKPELRRARAKRGRGQSQVKGGNRAQTSVCDRRRRRRRANWVASTEDETIALPLPAQAISFSCCETHHKRTYLCCTTSVGRCSMRRADDRLLVRSSNMNRSSDLGCLPVVSSQTSSGR